MPRSMPTPNLWPRLHR